MAKGDLVIKLLADPANAIKGFGATEKSAGGLSKNISKASGVIVGAVAGVAVGLAGAAAVGISWAKSAADDAAAAKTMAVQLHNVTGATNQQIDAVETWIARQGELTGITDDELRPAISKLATATGDIAESQKLATLAQDVAIGTGKDYGTVVAALAKGATGSTTSLGKLGIATKDAQGKALSFDKIVGQLSHSFAGQASASAQTFSGKMKIFSTQVSEAKESIGYVLLPILTKLVDYFTAHVVPAIQTVVGWFEDHKDKINDVATAIGDKLQPPLTWLKDIIVDKIVPGIKTFVGFLKDHEQATKNAAIAVGILTTAIVAINVVTAIWNALLAINPIFLIIAGVAALTFGITLLVENWDLVWGKIKEIVSTAWDWMKDKVFTPMGDFFVHIWDGITDGAKSALNAALGIVESYINLIITAVNSLASPINAAAKLLHLGVSLEIPKVSLPRLEVGTDYFQGGLALVGERGPELVSMPRGSQVATADETRSIMTRPTPQRWAREDLDYLADRIAKGIRGIIPATVGGAR